MKPDNLSLKDQLALSMGILTITLVVMLALYIPVGPRKTCLKAKNSVTDLKADLVMAQGKLMDEQARYGEQQALMQNLKDRPANFDLFSFLNGVLRETNLFERAQLENDKSSRSSAKQPMVRLRLEGVNLTELVDFLHKVYAGNNVVAVYKLDRLEAATNDRGLICEMLLVTIKV